MTVVARNISVKGVRISAEAPPVPGIFTIESSYVDDPYAGFTINRSGNTDGTASVDWAITAGAYDANAGTGAYVPIGNFSIEPGSWDQPNSGYILTSEQNLAGDFPALLGLKQGGINSLYSLGNGNYDTSNGLYSLFFTYNSAVTVNSITFEVTTELGPVGFRYYTSLTADANDDYYLGFNWPSIVQVSGERKYYTYDFPSPITIRSFLLTGLVGYPQGAPLEVYGISNNFLPSVSGTAEFGNREILVNVDTTFMDLSGPPTDVTLTLSNPVNGSIGTPSAATGTVGLPVFSITSNYDPFGIGDLAAVQYTISRSGSTNNTVTVDWTIGAGALSGTTGLYSPVGTKLADPSDFNSTNSGTMSATNIGSTGSFPALLANKNGSLDSAYDGGEEWYNMGSTGNLLFFTYDDPVTMSSLAIEAETFAAGPPAFKFYSDLTATADETYFGANPPVAIKSPKGDYWYYNFGTPITVQSLLITLQSGATSPDFIFSITPNFVPAITSTASFGLFQSNVTLDTYYSNSFGGEIVEVSLSNPTGTPPVPSVGGTSPITIQLGGGVG